MNFIAKAGIAAGLSAGMFLLAGAAITDKARLFVDSQKDRCLPWLVFISLKESNELRIGELVTVDLPYERLEGSNNLGGKLIAAKEGDEITIKDDFLFVNGRPWGWLWLRESLGKPKGYFDKKFVIEKDEVFLLGTEASSYDSRYWGPVKKESVKERIYAVL